METEEIKKERINRANAYVEGKIKFRNLYPRDLLYVRRNGKMILKVEKAKRFLNAVVLANVSEEEIDSKTIGELYSDYKKRKKR